MRGYVCVATCTCKCGTIKDVNVYNLLNSTTKNCGCGRKETMSKIKSKDFSGMLFGKLKVITPIGLNEQHRIIYKCKCDCGNIVNVPSGCLANGHTTSCGCVLSKSNMLIASWFSENNISYLPEYSIDAKGRKLRFDFYLPYYNSAIEYDGEQHYFPVSFGEKDASIVKQKFIDLQKRDKLKNDYCIENNISLLRIPYWEKENIKTILSNYLQRLSERDITV